MVVVGIDPGISNLGYGVVERRGDRLVALDGGVVATSPSIALELRLAEIARRVGELIADHRPVALAVESLYFGRNVQTALSVGQARGAVLAIAGGAGVPVTAYTPQQIKQAVCGSGGAGKSQVQRMVSAMLDLGSDALPDDHAADALGAAICYLNAAPFAAAVANVETRVAAAASATVPAAVR